MKNQRAITLIALTITVVVLILLSGVFISATIDNKGIFTKAQVAKNEYMNEQAYYQEKLENLKNEDFASNKNDSLPENTQDTPAGTIVKTPDNWMIQTARGVGLKSGKDVTNVTKVATVYSVAVGNGKTVAVPYGFWYVGGNLNTGVIISDNEQDKYDGTTDKTTHSYRKNLLGNQFVWIPCSIDNYNFVTTYANNSDANYCYDRIPGEIAQIEKYGGFYVGRYEAGICMPTGDETQNNKSGIARENILNGTEATSWQSDEFTSTTGKPVVRAGAIPWYHADHTTAINVAENMYKGNPYVSSGLLTGTMWDQMIAKIGDGNLTTLGNYNDSAYTTDSGVYHTSADASGTVAWSSTSAAKSNGSTWIVESGMLDTYSRYHIYDTAGNLWEWVDQNASDSSANVAFTLRGGSFSSAASSNPASYRDYDHVSTTDTNSGFRVALYIK